MKISAIIAAAGRGKRFNNGTDKAFLSINGTPIILMSLQVLLSIPDIDEIIITLNRENIGKAEEHLRFKGVSFEEGGNERVLSVRNAIFKSKNDFVLIHDAARPLINKSFVESIIRAFDDNIDGVIPVIPVRSTIKEKDNNDFIRKTIPRESLVEVQTPQFLRKDMLLKAYMSDTFDSSATDEAALLESIGGRIKAVVGLEENIKVTTAFDFFLIGKILEQWRKE